VSPFDTRHLRGIEIRAMVKLLVFALVGSAALFNSASTFGQALETVRVGIPSPSLSVLALRTAQVKNLFREEGLDVSLIQLATNVTITALTTKEVDYATASVAAMRSAISGLPVRTVMFVVRRPLHVLLARPEINSVQDLRGKIVSIGAYNDLTDFVLRAILARHNLDKEKDIKNLVISGSGSRLTALLTGTIDGAILPPPFNVEAEKKGFKRLASGADVYEGGITGLSTHTDKLRENPDQIRKMIRALLKGHSFLKTNKAESVRLISDWLKMDSSVAGASYDMYLNALSDDGLVSDRALMLDIARTREAMKIKDEVPLSRVVDFSLVKEISGLPSNR
jgi:ABC-type nitrate/sulfonate/bicarbonate transport system substrate-binding protein